MGSKSFEELIKDLSPSNLEYLLEECWSRETSSDPDNWSFSNKAYGQCAITALIVQDAIGGNLLRVETLPPDKKVSHYYNEVDGKVIDFTRKQFANDTKFSEPQYRERSYVLSYPATEKRYSMLKQSIVDYMNTHFFQKKT